jgi:hypothetical protein
MLIRRTEAAPAGEPHMSAMGDVVNLAERSTRGEQTTGSSSKRKKWQSVQEHGICEPGVPKSSSALEWGDV